MIIRTCAFTDKGQTLAVKLEEAFDNLLWEHKDAAFDTHEWVRESFDMKAPLIFIGAAGIAVRMIAPFVTDKLTDSSVIVIDEKGEYVIPILSGHVGGANRWASKIAAAIQAKAVITTATDVEELFSVDVFADKNGLRIVNRDGIRKVSSKLLREGSITMVLPENFKYKAEDVPECIKIVSGTDNEAVDVLVLSQYDSEPISAAKAELILVCKPYVLGVGCKKNTDAVTFSEHITDILKTNGIDIENVCAMASIDLKQKEYALNYFETKNRIPFFVYSANDLQQVEGNFAESDFVKDVTGVSNVCERAAVKHAGEDADLVIPKTAGNGITIAAAKKREWVVTWET